MMSKFLAKMVVSLFMGTLIISCAKSGSFESSSGNGPIDSQAPSSNKEQNLPSGKNSIQYQLPLSPDIPPDDMIQQIAFSGRGGPGSYDCSSNCAYMLDNHQTTLSLTYFQPNQWLTLDIYYPTGNTSGGSEVYAFLTEFSIQVDENGSLVIDFDRPCAFWVLDYETRIALAHS